MSVCQVDKKNVMPEIYSKHENLQFEDEAFRKCNQSWADYSVHGCVSKRRNGNGEAYLTSRQHEYPLKKTDR